MTPEQAAWLDQVHETALEPELPICDAHHHLWDRAGERYLLDGLLLDTGAGHHVKSTVFVDCMSGYRSTGPERLRPVGETEFVRPIAESSASGGGAVIAGIVGYADLRLGVGVEEVLVAHEAAGGGRFRGIRHATAWDADPSIRENHVGSPPGLMVQPPFLDGLAVLARLGLTYDAWLYHPQLPELVEAARAVQDLVIVLDHLGGPLAIGAHSDRPAAMAEWRASMSDVASCPNVVVKLGGIGMAYFAIPWHHRDEPPTSSELADVWADDIGFVIDAFGVQRCMFESNFPVDRKSCSYTVLWNAFKRIAADLGAEDKRWLFHDTAATTYRLGGRA